MSEGQLRPGSFVRYGGRNGRVGKVKEIGDGNPAVLFWADRESGDSEKIPPALLTPLADDGPEALLWERPEELGSWAKERPLQLVAAALTLNGPSKIADIREKLDVRVPLGVQWAAWWKKRTKPLNNLPEHFEAVKTSKGSEYRLLSSVADVPPDWTPPPKPKQATLEDWKKWLAANANEPPPGRYPTKGLCDALAKWPAKDIDTASACIIRGAEGFLSSERRPSKQVAAAWMEAITQASARQRECANRDYLDGRVGGLLRELAGIAGRDKALRILADAFVAPDRYAEELTGLRQSLHDAEARHASELEDRQRDHSAEIEKLKQSHAAELEGLRLTHAAELERERQEQERLRQQVRERNAELSANREESRLEIRQDMLLAVGEVLQSVHRRNVPGELAGNVAAGLILALRAGGAEPLGTPGETVTFDPECHTADGNVPANGRVSVIAPGVVYRGGTHGDRVLLKANVKHEAV